MITIYSRDFVLHHDPNHIENRNRLKPILKAIREYNIPIKRPYKISKRVIRFLELAHSKEYLHKIKKIMREAYTQNKIIYIDGDTYISPLTWRSAFRSVLAVIRAVNLIDKYHKIFIPTRPPGHHAGKYGIANTVSQGFCIFNNVAIASLYAKEKGFDKIAVLDVDLHHGNGTEDILARKDKIYYISIHSKYIYPGTGYSSYDNVYNIPLDPQIGDEEYLNAFNLAIGLIEKINPDLILVSLGFDTHKDDPLSTFNISYKTYIQMFKTLNRIDNIIYVLEGGYNLDVLYKGTKILFETLQD